MTQVTTLGYVGVAGRNESFDHSFSAQNTQFSVNGLDGNDLVAGFDKDDYLVGGLGGDLIVGNSGNDVMIGDQFQIDETDNPMSSLAAAADLITDDAATGGGNDIVFAGGGNNYVNTGIGNDFISGGAGREMLQGGAGDDEIRGQAGNDLIFGGSSNNIDQDAFITANIGTNVTTSFNGITDAAETNNYSLVNFSGPVVLSGSGADYLDGGAGNDTIDGGDGADTMIGGTGDDTFIVDDAGDTVTEFEFQGIDEIYTSISTSLVANIENVTLVNTTEGAAGNALANRIVGNASANYLAGAEGNDTIRGLGGNDRLIGGLGRDTLTGGTESDKFIYNARTEGGDTVTDFLHNVDDFVFLGSAFGGLAAGALNSALFQSGVADHALSASVRFFYEEDTHILRYDPDGSGSSGGVGIATLQASATMSASDFLIV